MVAFIQCCFVMQPFHSQANETTPLLVMSRSVALCLQLHTPCCSHRSRCADKLSQSLLCPSCMEASCCAHLCCLLGSGRHHGCRSRLGSHETKVAEPTMLAQLDITVAKTFQVCLCVWLTVTVTVSAVVAAVVEVMKTDRRTNCHTHRRRPTTSMTSTHWSSLSSMHLRSCSRHCSGRCHSGSVCSGTSCRSSSIST